jgi:Fe-S-cluster containining protein
MIYECDRCGACWRRLIIEISALDIVREPRLLAAITPFQVGRGFDPDFDSDEEEEEYERLGPLVPEADGGGSIKMGPDHSCPLLGEDNLCTIYPTRPNVCVAMRAGSDQCQMARERAGLPPLEEK